MMVETPSGPVLTIGHSDHSLATFLGLLSQHEIGALADVRTSPYSRLHPQFNQDQLRRALSDEGVKYVYLGDALGGRPRDPSCYENGRVRYDRVAATDHFRGGLARVVEGASRYRVALMCAEREPLDCHRTLLVGQALDDEGLEVEHILVDGTVETHRETMDRLLSRHGLALEGDLVTPRTDSIAAVIALQASRIAYAPPTRGKESKP